MSGQPPVVWVVAARSTAERWVAALRKEGYAAGALAWAASKALPVSKALHSESDLVLLTSARAAHVLPEGAGAGRAAACVGKSTAEAARAKGFDVVLVGEAGGEDLARRILKLKPKPHRVLFPCGRDARAEAPGVLAHGGVDVDQLPVYAMTPLPDFAERVARAPEPQAIVLGSPKAVDALAAAGRALPAGAPLIALGAVTGERAEACFGRQVTRTPTAGVRGVLEALRTALRTQ